MSNNVRVVSASLSNGQRAQLLRRFTPTFANVFCMQVTWSYNVPQDCDFPKGPLDLTVYARHIGADTDCLLARIKPAGAIDSGTGDQRPDGKWLHITLSTRPGIPPARAGEIGMQDVELIDPIELRIQFHNRSASRLVPTMRMAA